MRKSAQFTEYSEVNRNFDYSVFKSDEMMFSF